jgi:hypothetical protein
MNGWAMDPGKQAWLDTWYPLIKLSAGVFGTVGLYSVLYKENKFYRWVEHLYLGLAGGYSMIALWTETLDDTWWSKMVGKAATSTDPAVPGMWAYALLLPIGAMGYFVFSKKYNWLAKIPIGIILGLFAGQQVQAWWNIYGPQINKCMEPILPTTLSRFTVPPTIGLSPQATQAITQNIYQSQALSNLIFVATIICVLCYFLFSFELKSKIFKGMTRAGRMALMIGFGAIFGSTVLMRFTLLIDRMYFICIQWFQQGILHR